MAHILMVSDIEPDYLEYFQRFLRITDENLAKQLIAEYAANEKEDRLHFEKHFEKLPPHHRGVYIQYIKDPEDDILVSGFLKETLPKYQVTPQNVERCIASFYSKSDNLFAMINALKLQLLMRVAIHDENSVDDDGRSRPFHRSAHSHCKWTVVIPFAFIAMDITLFVISLHFHCSNDGGWFEELPFWMWMVIGSVVHCAVVGGFLSTKNATDVEFCPLMTQYCSLCGALLLLPWAVIGSVLAAEAIAYGVNDKMCTGVALVWIVANCFVPFVALILRARGSV